MRDKWQKGILKVRPAWNKGLIGYWTGKRNPRWKNGITEYWHKIRNSKEYKEWRLKVFERDNYTCQNCGSKSGKDYDGTIYLEAHHSVKFAKLLKTVFEKYIYDIRNGITLCKNCHNFIPKKIKI